MAAAPLIACSRMYNVASVVRARWDDLFAWLGREAGVVLDIVGHEAPAPLSQLWARPDMGAVFMCGFPLLQSSEETRPTILAAPVAQASWAGDRPCYASHIVVADDGPIRSVTDLPGAVWGWTVRDSQSGYHAARAFLADRFRDRIVRPQTVGPLLNPSQMMEALRAGRVEAGAIDAYAHDLMARHTPDTITGLRIIATTDPMPCPVLVSSRGAPADRVSALCEALLAAHENAEGRAVIEPLAVARFECPDASDYRVLGERAEATNRTIAPW